MTAAKLPERLSADRIYLSTAGDWGELLCRIENEELSAEIARRWNAHEALVAALERALWAIDTNPVRAIRRDVSMELQAALRAAREEVKP